MKKLLIIGSLLLLASCNNKIGKDGYSFGEKQYEQSPVSVSVVVYDKQNDIYEAAKQRGVDSPNIAAFTVLSADRSKCTIHMIDPAVKYRPEFVGHEFLHCVYGQWHTSNEERS